MKCCLISRLHFLLFLRDLTDTAVQQFTTKQLRLVSATNDMDGFVEIELDRQGYTCTLCPQQMQEPWPLLLTPSTSRPIVCEGGRTGASVTESRDHVRGKCGVFIGRWRPNSKLDPAMRTRVAVKVMEKGKKTNAVRRCDSDFMMHLDIFLKDIQHLVSMDFPYVNHFLGEFESSRQLKVGPGSSLTIMASSYCCGGDHWSAMHHPVSQLAYFLPLQAHADGQLQRFCFCNPDHPEERVNHSMVQPLCVEFQNGRQVEAFSYICVCDGPSTLAGTICRVEKIDDRFFYLWSAGAACRYPYPETEPPISSLQFSTRFCMATGEARCIMLLGEKESSDASLTLIKQFRKCMPRPNVAFLRAFSVQLLRGLGYCHSCKLTSHNGKTALFFSPLTALIEFSPLPRSSDREYIPQEPAQRAPFAVLHPPLW